MEVLDRYLTAVRFWLPEAQQDDILAELSEDLRSQMEETEARLGRKLEEAEMEAILKRRGHPMWVAEPYLPQRHLIGPVLLPAYRRVVKITIAATLVVFAVLYAVIGVAAGGAASLRELFFWLWQACLYAFAHVGLQTWIFARLERSQARARSADAWDPHKPWALPGLPADPRTQARQNLRVSSAGEFAGDVLFLLWWLNALPLPSIPVLQVHLTPAWEGFFLPVALQALLSAGLTGALIVRPERTRRHCAVNLVNAVAAVLLAVALLHVGPWVTVASTQLPAALTGAVAQGINASVWITLVTIGVIYIFEGLRDVRVLRGGA